MIGNGERLRNDVGAVTGLEGGLSADRERFLRGGGSVLHGRGNILRGKVSVLRGGGSVSRDGSSVPRGAENERKVKVSQIKTRR